jgi:hypothetical protein
MPKQSKNYSKALKWRHDKKHHKIQRVGGGKRLYKKSANILSHSIAKNIDT